MVSVETQNLLRAQYLQAGKILNDLANELGHASRSSVMEMEAATPEQVVASAEILRRVELLKDFMFSGKEYTDWSDKELI